MILCVCLNPALDVTYEVAGLAPGATNQVHVLGHRGGGKGINVARVLRQLGEPTVVTGLLGGTTGADISRDLAAVDVPERFTRIAGESRRTVTIVDGGHATVLNEPGPHVSEREWAAFLVEFDALVAGCEVVVLAGSLPPGTPRDAYCVLTTRAKAAGALVVVDAAGDVLHAALRAQPDLVKPNATELGELVGHDLTSREDVLRAAEWLLVQGAQSAVVSRGVQGLVAVSPVGAFSARAPRPVKGNATGAGDALTAALAMGLRRGDAWPRAVDWGVAVSAAAVTVPMAGETDLAYAHRLLPDVKVETLSWA